ncbi:MAG TPA: M23 family metallopeptidase, partial [Phototrophicaceae bacterium]|nr:M23 family metallopeptidase [Phototrophicaceae bacterium]
AHLSAIYVTRSQQVTAGTILGAMGNTGNSTAPHLHLEVRASTSAINITNYKRIDPLKMFME